MLLSISVQIRFSSVDSWVYPFVACPGEVTEQPEREKLLNTDVTLLGFQGDGIGMWNWHWYG